MNGRVSHERNPQMVQFACYVTEKMGQVPERLWPKTFKTLTENTKHDISELRAEIWRRLK